MRIASAVVAAAGPNYTQSIETAGFTLLADEPQAAGGQNAGPGPYNLLLAALEDRQLGIVVERWLAVALRVRQRDPELGELEPARRIGRRVLGVRESAPRRHEIDLARPDQLAVAEAVGVLDRSLDHPCEGLQPDVRVRPDDEAATRRIVSGSGVVEEAPGADQAAVPVGQSAADLEAIADNGAFRFESFDGHSGMMRRLEGADNQR